MQFLYISAKTVFRLKKQQNDKTVGECAGNTWRFGWGKDTVVDTKFW